MSDTRERRWLIRVLADEVRAAYLLIGVAAVSLVWANSPLGPRLRDFANLPTVGGLTLSHFTSEWLICLFFLLAGIELGHELRFGSLANLRSALVPVAAAVGGMVGPAVLYLLLGGDRVGWGVPMPTDLPMALAVLAIAAPQLPLAARAFMLSLAVVDDVLSVLVLGFGFGGGFSATWVAVLVGILWPSRGRFNAERVRIALQPWSAGLVLPLFALTSLALPLDLAALAEPSSYTIAVARIVGKLAGIILGASLLARLLKVRLPFERRYLGALGAAASLGFSVSLLFVESAPFTPAGKAAALLGVVVALVLAFGWAIVAISVVVRPLRR